MPYSGLASKLCFCTPSKWRVYPFSDLTVPSRSRVVSPVLDVIDWKTLQYYPSEDQQRGVLDWKLDFRWEPLPERERRALASPVSPLQGRGSFPNRLRRSSRIAVIILTLLYGGVWQSFQTLKVESRSTLSGVSVQLRLTRKLWAALRPPDTFLVKGRIPLGKC